MSQEAIPTPTPSERAAATLRAVFDKEPTLISTAPGRVNLIGEHTDYNDGFVLPAAIQYHTAIAAAPSATRNIEVVADDVQREQVSFALDEPIPFDAERPWSNYLRGVVQTLRNSDFQLCGARLAISGNVPLGAGLSASAALEISAIAALTALSGEAIDIDAAAQLGQRAENEFVGVPCGIMDQLISAAGERDHALLLDCRSLQRTSVALPAGFALLIINSNVKHALVDGQYRARREQCEAAARHYAVAALRDLDEAALHDRANGLDPTAFRRARHVVTENQRTLDLAAALAAGNVEHINTLMASSHASMRDDFEITVPEIDSLVDMAAHEIGASGGVRMTGGGFGGSVVALLPESGVTQVVERVMRDYPIATGRQPTPFICRASAGAFNRGSELG